MTHELIALGIVSLLELSIWLPPIWKDLRKPVACIAIILLSMASAWYLSSHWSGWTLLVVILSGYRIFNLLRIVEDRPPLDYMALATLRTSLMLISSQLLLVFLAYLGHHTHISLSSWLAGARLTDLAIALLLLLGTMRHVRKTQALPITNHIATRDLPTLTVAVPARNETDDLDSCLQSLIASSYPKLEILVLDDCSQDKHTPEIIKGFAHDGVRFMAGKKPPEHWLAKNYAYQQLADEANGEILLFCGVDTRFEPDSLELMVETMLARKKAMLSILPSNALPSSHNPESAIIQPLRYAWELALPRRWFKRPPVLSTCWLIRSKLLKDSGGFKAVTSSTSVESYFARIAVAKNNSYSFLRSAGVLGLMSHKSTDEQRATAIRTRYPQTHRRPEIVAAIGLAEAFILIAPFVLLVSAAVTHSWLNLGVSIFNVVVVTLFYVVMLNVTYGVFLVRGLWSLLLASFYDIALLNHSMWRYEFREVIWKDRNICLPLRHFGLEQSES
jgi:glycosyltransferase involved in cell wall biosynthesis